MMRHDKDKNPIFVANHTSMIDMVVLAQRFTFAVVGQKHGGWVGVLQTRVRIIHCHACVQCGACAEKACGVG